MEMDNFSKQWLETLLREEYAPLFASHGYSTFARCAQLTEEKLTVMGITDGVEKELLLDSARRLKETTEAAFLKELPVSFFRHTELSIIWLTEFS